MNEQRKNRFWDRALRNLRGAWGKIASPDANFSTASLSPDLSGGDREIIIEQMRASLQGRGGEVSARGRTAALGNAYLALSEDGRRVFVDILANEFDIDQEETDAAIQVFSAANTPTERLAAESRLKQALEAPRIRLLTQFNDLPEGVKFLVDLRAEILSWRSNDAGIQGLERDLKSLLTSWFDIGFLEPRQITWQAPAALLEKLFQYEAVHEIKSWDDLKNRLAQDRRCFAYFHPRMPDEPLIFVWVALVNGMSTDITTLLDEAAPQGNDEKADTAVFYSISNAQDGLKGINFGNFLIKRVVDSLCQDLPGLNTFATLSPIPGFRKWLNQQLEAGNLSIVPEGEQEKLMHFAGRGSPETAITDLLAQPDWISDPNTADALKSPLSRLAAQYLIQAKRESGTALDSVAHFHLNNGARVEKINWAADPSLKGVEQSCGIMLNYLYELSSIEANHESYRSGHAVIAAPAVEQLLRG